MFEILIHVFVIVCLPLTFAAGLLRSGVSRWEWWSTFVLTAATATWAFLVGRWDLVGYPIRYVLPALTVGVLLIGWQRRRGMMGLTGGNARSFSVILSFFLSVVFFLQAGFAWAGFIATEAAVELAFPLRGGTYFVVQGGSTVLVNYHAAYPPQAYALDVSRLYPLGYRAIGLYPKGLDRYSIFGEPIYSPCSGEVVAARDGLPDHVPPARDGDHPEGNFVTVRCHGVDVVLAHLQQNSVLVAAGDEVSVGQPLGRVGNSGNTTEPHLHMHAERWVERPDGTQERLGVPMRFDGRFLGRNSLVVVP